MRQQPLVVMKPDDVRPPGDIVTQHALDVPPRTFQVTQGQQRQADQTVADWPVGGIGGFRRIGAKFFGYRQRRPIAAARHAVDEQAPKRSQAVIRIVEAFRDLKGACKGC
jgi:hypothetical protein